MIALSNSSLKYAVDVCKECSDYIVGIVPYDVSEMKYIIEKLTDLTMNCDECLKPVIKNNGYNYYIEFKNGSILKVIRASNSAGGHRFHLVILNKYLCKEIRDILRSIETMEWL